MIEFTAIVFGLVVGSFLNVCILRIPKRESIVFPASHCPRCKTPIRWFDNIPVLSWLLLAGRCRVPACRARISLQYPLIELLTGGVFGLTFYQFGLSFAALKWVVLFCILMIHAVTDLRERFLSFELNIFGFFAGIVLSTLSPVSDGTAFLVAHRLLGIVPPAAVLGFFDALLGALFGAGFLWLPSVSYRLVTGHEGMGLGDVYLMGLIGSFLGPMRTFLTLLVGSVLGSILGVLFVLLLFLTGWKSDVAERAYRRGLGSLRGLRFALARKFPFPLGTYLGVGAALVVFFYTSLLDFVQQFGARLLELFAGTAGNG